MSNNKEKLTKVEEDIKQLNRLLFIVREVISDDDDRYRSPIVFSLLDQAERNVAKAGEHLMSLVYFMDEKRLAEALSGVEGQTGKKE